MGVRFVFPLEAVQPGTISARFVLLNSPWFPYVMRRRVICGSLYTAHEGFSRLLMIHAGQGGDIASFNWRDYVGARKGASLQPEHTWYVPTPQVSAVAKQILEQGAFDKVTVNNRGMRKESRGSVVRAQRWTGFRLRKAAGNRDKLVALAPFEVRASREESAMRLAIEADASGRSWRQLAAACSLSNPRQRKPGGAAGQSTRQVEVGLPPTDVKRNQGAGRVTRAQRQREVAASTAAAAAVPAQAPGANVCL